MSRTPTEVKAARAIADAWGWTVLTSWHRLTGDEQEKCLSAARAVLVAVGPMIAAQAWDEGMALGHNDSRRLLDKWAKNPYRQEAGR